MEYLIFFVTIGSLLIILALKGAWDARKQKRYFINRLYQDYGQKPQREYKIQRFVRIDGYYRKHQTEGQLDDITWNDLNMDDIFKRMNYTLSSTGEEYLYHTLRTPKMSEKELQKLEACVAYFEAHEDERVKVQLLMKELGTTGNHSLYDYMEYLDTLRGKNNRKILLTDSLYLVFAGLCFVNLSLGLLGIVGLIVYQITTYFKEKKEIEPYMISFSYMMRLVQVCRKLTKLPIPPCEESWETIHKSSRSLGKLRLTIKWLLSNSAAVGSGNPLELLLDYLNMACHLDIILFYKMYHIVSQHLQDVDELVTQAGTVEVAVCIACFRASLGKMKDAYCLPVFAEKDRPFLKVQNGYHPLIEHPVRNSIYAKRGVLLTGSNASGKSTFLKTLAVNAILAQTIHTCTAESYSGSFFRIFTSMALKDSVETGESYYIVEIKSLKRVIDCNSQYPVICFVDEVLRGTNTVERIAASTQILKSLNKENRLCFAATHDVELTQLLQEEYDNYHFEEQIMDGDIVFPYQLMAGKATSRNAIRLLEIMGYEEEIIRLAVMQAEHFMATGSWELS